MIPPEQIVSRMTDRIAGEESLKRMVMDRAEELMHSAEPIYLAMDVQSFEYATILTRREIGRMIGWVDSDSRPGRSPKDWAIVTNAAGAATLRIP
jgi:hypothetical protein